MALNDDFIVWLVTVLVALMCVPPFIRIVLTIPLHVSLNYNEGWNAYHALEVMRGSPLYPAAPHFFFNNYPPLSFYLMAGATRLVGDPIVAGRWTSLVAFMAWVVLVGASARRLGCRRDRKSVV